MTVPTRSARRPLVSLRGAGLSLRGVDILEAEPRRGSSSRPRRTRPAPAAASRPAPARPSALLKRRRARCRCPQAGRGSAARRHRRARSGALGSGPALPASRLPGPAAGELAGPAPALRCPAGCRRSPPPAECMRLTLLCCTWREERMGEEGAPGLGSGEGSRECLRGPRSCKAAPLPPRDAPVLPKPAGHSLSPSHPLSPFLGPGMSCSPEDGGSSSFHTLSCLHPSPRLLFIQHLP